MALSISRPKHRSLTNPSLIHLFSSSPSSSSPSNEFAPEDASDSQNQPQNTSRSSPFTDIKASLKQPQHNPQSQNQLNRPNLTHLRTPGNVNPSISKPTSTIPLDEIRKNLAEFRRRSSVPSPTGSDNGAPSESNQQQRPEISFQQLYKQNQIEKSREANNFNESSVNYNKKSISGKLAFDAIRESLQRLSPNASANTTRKIGPINSSVIGGTEGLPFSMGKGQGTVPEGMSTGFVKMYSYGELGEKLRSLRPEVKEGEKGWFSLEELNERLSKLRELEEKETESKLPGMGIRDLRQTLVKLKMSEEEKFTQNSMQRLSIMSQLGATPNYMMQPPKQHLVEKYFHPDNMSSAEKLKIELAQVREEFKMSESDCGSARVQVAQLTTKIKHLSSVLHKKDKHSKKGLHGMVQRRKQLLRYLRRTDWDSYCLVLSKLGLRDNPDFKH